MLLTYAQPRNQKITTIFQRLIILITFFCILLSSSNLFAAQVRVIFARSSDSRVEGYKFFYGKSKSFSNEVDLGNNIEYTTPSLEKGTLYYFAAKAYDKYGNQSPFSEIVSYNIPTDTNTSTGSNDDGTGSTPTNESTSSNDNVTGSTPTTFSELNENFQNYPVGSSPSMWLSTKAGNSMVEDENLFKVHNINQNGVFGTTSTLTNIHSHHVESYIDNLTSFEYSGRMLMTHQDGGIGVTFLSHYPFADNYYRLRRSKGSSSFRLAPHPHATAKVFGIIDSGVVPNPNQWYKFRILVENTDNRTEILAKVWPENSSEPQKWQIDAYDNTPDRFVSGTVGMWSMDAGAKYWDDLKIFQ
jgi:hypothetical protein